MQTQTPLTIATEQEPIIPPIKNKPTVGTGPSSPEVQKSLPEMSTETRSTKAHYNNSSGQSWVDIMNNKHRNEAGPSTFLGSSSNLDLLLEPSGDSNTFSYVVPDEVSYSSSRLKELNKEEIEILKFRGAFLLPPRDLCDDIVETYFEKIHPTFPYLNRSQFMRRYNDPVNPPSLLLLQAILLAGSRVCKNPALIDESGTADLASLTFYKRAKALFDANYESDRLIIVQAVVLLSWWWEGPEDVTKNAFYWSRVALGIAQGIGLHRSMDKTNMALSHKRSWKRMWWSLFVLDRWVSVSLGRPLVINLEDSDVPMITEEDFNEDEPGHPSLYPANKTNILYFIHAVKLSEIIGLVMDQQFSVSAEISRRKKKVPFVSHCDMALGSWMKSLPPELKYSVKDKSNHNFFKAALHAQYYTVLCLAHRSNILRKGIRPTNDPYPSWGIAFQAAHMISKIMENLLLFDECRDLSATYLYTLFSAMIMLIYQTEAPQPSVVESAKTSLAICLAALEETSHTWMMARIIVKLFQQLYQNKTMREKFVNEARKRPYETALMKDIPIKKSNTKTDNTLALRGNTFTNRRKDWSYDVQSIIGPSDDSNMDITDSGIPYVKSDKNSPGSLNTWTEIAKKKDDMSNMWKRATRSVPQPPSDDGSTPSTTSENDNKCLNSEKNSSNGYLMIANNEAETQAFYDNFQLSQLFPETSPGSRETFSDELFLGLNLYQAQRANATPGAGSTSGAVSNSDQVMDPDSVSGEGSSKSPAPTLGSTPSDNKPSSESLGHDSHNTLEDFDNPLNLSNWYTSLNQKFNGTIGIGMNLESFLHSSGNVLRSNNEHQEDELDKYVAAAAATSDADASKQKKSKTSA